jgi:hypothetical protein
MYLSTRTVLWCRILRENALALYLFGDGMLFLERTDGELLLEG